MLQLVRQIPRLSLYSWAVFYCTYWCQDGHEISLGCRVILITSGHMGNVSLLRRVGGAGAMIEVERSFGVTTGGGRVFSARM